MLLKRTSTSDSTTQDSPNASDQQDNGRPTLKRTGGEDNAGSGTQASTNAPTQDPPDPNTPNQNAKPPQLKETPTGSN